ncbi:N6-adenine-specific methylase [Candidatus Blochmanniella floridana]|uniref:Ribosomal RNA small subunit methyltransferase D n=1 Tax=Blochmanniella floridana TaxID=203907 RepID=Q7VRI5_BLOFL|nr:N6-adenine-specific methylase [Candidatus Blochmannia floridanus]
MSRKSGYLRNGKIRIIAGKWKGRKILVSNQVELRPTLSRIRETLFDWLNPIISGTVCLDCFAGSGALGLESLSRGAQKVTFIDRNLICISVLDQVIQSLHEYNVKIIHADCCQWLQYSNDSYDIIFLDPPFRDYMVLFKVIFLLEKYNHFKEKSWIYLEVSKSVNIISSDKIPSSWILYRKIITKTIFCCLYLRKM